MSGDERVPKPVFLLFRDLHVLNVDEQSVVIHVENVDNAGSVFVVVMNSAGDPTSFDLRRRPVRKTRLRVVLPTFPFAFGMVACLRYWRERCCQLIRISF